jgi:hypothetical protein
MASFVSYHIPDELLSIIFSYLDSLSLLRMELVSPLWCSVCRRNDELIWTHHVQSLTKHSPLNTPSELNIKKRIEQLKMNRLLKGLVGIDLHRCIEKQDYQSMLLAKLLFKNIMTKELKGEDSRFAGKYVSVYYPEWALQMQPWKSSFLFVRSENNRQEITANELCSITWEFSFKYQMNPETNETEENNNPSETFRVMFHDDFSMFSELQPHHNYTWKFVQMHGNEKLYIQVDSYPPLSIFRYENLGWGLENMYVRIRQKIAFDPASIPVV